MVPIFQYDREAPKVEAGGLRTEKDV